MNANIAEYHVPVNADVHDIKVIFVEEPDSTTNPLGIKGVARLSDNSELPRSYLVLRDSCARPCSSTIFFRCVFHKPKGAKRYPTAAQPIIHVTAAH